ncbi:MAG: response regulator, partial [Bdellovibrionota bacterium]
NGKDGFALLQTLKPPFLVLLDQNMPVATGDDFLRQRLRHPALAAIPVIVMSAVVDRTTHLGAIDFMNKPIDMAALLKKIKTHLGPGSSAPPASSALPSDVSARKSPNGSKPGGAKKVFVQLFAGFRLNLRAWDLLISS